jgi:hypothetical protein
MATLAMSTSNFESEKNGYKKMSAITTKGMSGNEIPEALLNVLSIRSKPGLICPEDIRSRIAQIRSRVESFRSAGIVRRMPSAESFPSARGAHYAAAGGGVGSETTRTGGSGNAFGRRNVGRNDNTFWNRSPVVASQVPMKQTPIQAAPPTAWSGRPKFTATGLNTSTVSVSPSPSVATPGNRFKTLDQEETEESPSPTPSPSVATPISPVGAGGYVKFKSKFKKDAANANELEDRILGHIRAKINKFSAQNYKKILNFLRQNMDSEEKVFLEQFMALIFAKAAEEDTFVALYAQLLADLTPEFPFLKGEMQKLFTSYLDVFVDADGKEDQTSAEYSKFLDANKRKTHRRGYSLFIAQIASKGLITEKELLDTTLAVARSLIVHASLSEQKLLVEELADCLTNILGVAHKSLNAFDEMRAMIVELKGLTAKAPADLPGLSFKSRFALMDCLGQ